MYVLSCPRPAMNTMESLHCSCLSVNIIECLNHWRLVCSALKNHQIRQLKQTYALLKKYTLSQFAYGHQAHR